MTHEFIVEITTTVPEGTDPAEVNARRAAEAVRAKELASSGNLVRLWRPVGELRSIGLWHAENEADPREHVLDTLPLRAWMELTITAVQPLPDGPGQRASVVDQAYGTDPQTDAHWRPCRPRAHS